MCNVCHVGIYFRIFNIGTKENKSTVLEWLSNVIIDVSQI